MQFAMPNAKLLVLILIFITSGMSSPLIVEVLRLLGGYFDYTMLIALPLCLGQSMAIFTNWNSRFGGVIRWKYIFLVSILDMISYAFNANGLLYAGSATYTIVHSSLTVFTAIFSLLILNVIPSRLQWGGISFIVLGLTVAVVNAEHDGREVLLGAVLIFLGTMVHALTYIASEYILVEVEDAISPELLCTITGLIPTIFYVTWQLIYTIPHFQNQITHHIHFASRNALLIFVCYILLAIAAFVHSTLFFYLIHHVGSTPTSMSKIFQSLGLFIASHVAFCEVRKSQCLTARKEVAFGLVLLGVALYSTDHMLVGHTGGADGEGESEQRWMAKREEYVELIDEGII